MYVCVCIYIYGSIYTCIYRPTCMCVYVCMYLCGCMYIYIYIYMYYVYMHGCNISMCVCMYVCMYVFMYVCMMDGCMYVCMCVYVCMYVSMYICTHACVYQAIWLMHFSDFYLKRTYFESQPSGFNIMTQIFVFFCTRSFQTSAPVLLQILFLLLPSVLRGV